MTDNERIAVLIERVDAIKATIIEMRREIDEMHAKLERIERAADKWRGAFIFLAGAGGVLVWALDFGQRIAGFLTKPLGK